MESYLLGLEKGSMALILVCQSMLDYTEVPDDRKTLEWDVRRGKIGLECAQNRLTAFRKSSESGQTTQDIYHD